MTKKTILFLITAMLFCSFSRFSFAKDKEICSKPSPKNKNLIVRIICEDRGWGFYPYCSVQKGDREEIEALHPGNGGEISSAFSCKHETKWSDDGRYFVYWHLKAIPYPDAPSETYRVPVVKIYDAKNNNIISHQEKEWGNLYPLKYFDKKCTQTMCEHKSSYDGDYFKLDIKNNTISFNVFYINKIGAKSKEGFYDGNMETCFVWRTIERVTMDIKTKKIKSRKSMEIRSLCYN